MKEAQENNVLNEIKNAIRKALPNYNYDNVEKVASDLIQIPNDYNIEIIDLINELLNEQFLRSQIQGKQILLKQLSRFIKFDYDTGDKTPLEEFLRHEYNRLVKNNGK
jgi:hypothetical protein